MEDEAGCVARSRARELAELGYKTHVIVPGRNYNTVDFEQGIWVHRMLPVESVKSEKANELNIPQDAWNLSKAFLDEVERISTHRNIDIVQAPITNLVGSAVLLSGMYNVITSLSVVDEELIKFCMGAKSYGPNEDGKSLEPIKLYMLSNSRGIVADKIETISNLEAFCEGGNMGVKIISNTQDITCLAQDYEAIVI